MSSKTQFTRQGELIDRSYVLHEKLGEGGMGAVYRATERITGRTVALKLLGLRGQADQEDEEVLLRLRLALAREFQILASVHHPHVIRVLSFGFDERHGPYFTMELVESCQDIVAASAARPLHDKVGLLAQLLRAMAYLHRRGILHRDLKPSNVLCQRDELKVVDFGIAASIASVDGIAGTIEYMAPELLLGKQPTAASDLYSVGVIMHQVLTGDYPYGRTSMSGFLKRILGTDSDMTLSSEASEFLALYGVSAGSAGEGLTAARDREQRLALIEAPLRGVVERLLNPAPQKRYQDAGEVLRDLSAAIGKSLPIETAATRESILLSSELVGREEELLRLTTALDRAHAGQGSGWLLAGESGVGKSRILAELRTLALVKNVWVAEGQAIAEGGSPYALWLPVLRALCLRIDATDEEAAILKGLVPDIDQFLQFLQLLERPIEAPASVAPPQASQERLHRVITSLLRRQERPVLLLLEDLQWAGADSIALLAHLGRLAHELPLLVVCNYRDDERPDLPQQLPSLSLLRIERLGRSSIARLSLSMLGPHGNNQELVDYLYRETEGNVFFLVEVIRALAEDAGQLDRVGSTALPTELWTGGMQRIVARRLERISASGRPALELAATLGRQLDLRVLAHLMPQLTLNPWLMECAEAAVLETQGNEWRFCHDKLREAVLRDIEPARLKRLHFQVAEALETVYSGAGREAAHPILAYHFSQAGALDRAVPYYMRAGQDALRLSLLKEARGFYAAAKAAIEQLPEHPALCRQHVDVLLMQVETGVTNDPAELNLQRIAKAHALLAQVKSTNAEAPEDRLRLARVEFFRARAQCYAGEQTQATAALQRILPVAGEFQDHELSARTAFVLGLSLMLQGRFSQALDAFARALPDMERLFGASLDTLRCCMYYAMTLDGAGQPRLASAQMARASGWVRATDQPMVTCLYHMTRMLDACYAADWPATLRAAEELDRESKKVSETMFTHTMLDAVSWAQSNLGQHDLALSSLERATELKRSLGDRTIAKDWWDAASAEILLNAGNPQAALVRAQQVADSSNGAGLQFSQALAERVIACALGRLGADMTEVEQHFAASLRICRENEQIVSAAQGELWWGRICRERGDQRAARHHFAQAIAELEAHGCGFVLDEARRISRGDEVSGRAEEEGT